MRIKQIDHIVLTVTNINQTIEFFSVLGLKPTKFGDPPRYALHFGSQKINLHQKNHEYKPNASKALPGSADICLIVEDTIENVISHLSQNDINIELGPVDRTGANGKIRSVYIRDPDGNLVELSNYL